MVTRNVDIKMILIVDRESKVRNNCAFMSNNLISILNSINHKSYIANIRTKVVRPR